MALLKRILTFILFLPLLAYSQAYGVYDPNKKEFQQELNSTDVRSIASITKMFTAGTIVRSGASMEEPVMVQGKSGGRFPRGSMVPRMDLFKAMLISSDNLAAESLAHGHPGGYDQFLRDVENTISHAGLQHTAIVEPTGLSADNKSTVEDIAKYLVYLQAYPIIQQVSSEREDRLQYKRGKKTVTVNLRNTNPSMWNYDSIMMSKTGFTNAAGRCVAMLVRRGSNLVAVVVLGQRDVRSRSRVVDTLFKNINAQTITSQVTLVAEQTYP